MERLRDKIADGPVLRWIESFLKADILDEASRWTPEAGAPQGAVLSPLLSHVSLDPLDHLVARSGFEMVRDADDFVILCRTAEEAHTALELVRFFVHNFCADCREVVKECKVKSTKYEVQNLGEDGSSPSCTLHFVLCTPLLGGGDAALG